MLDCTSLRHARLYLTCRISNPNRWPRNCHQLTPLGQSQNQRQRNHNRSQWRRFRNRAFSLPVLRDLRAVNRICPILNCLSRLLTHLKRIRPQISDLQVTVTTRTILEAMRTPIPALQLRVSLYSQLLRSKMSVHFVSLTPRRCPGYLFC